MKKLIRTAKRIWGDKGATYEIVKTPEDLEVVRDLRYQVFGLEASPPYISDRNKVTDDYDLVATNFIAKYNGEPAGGLRILNQKDLNKLKNGNGVVRNKDGEAIFPIETAQPEVGEMIRKRSAEGRNIIVVDKLVVPIEYSRKGIASGFYASCYDYCARKDVDDLFILVNCEEHLRKPGNEMPKEARAELARIPKAYTDIGFYPIGDIFDFGDFNAHAAVMHLPRKEKETTKLKILATLRKINGRMVDFSEYDNGHENNEESYLIDPTPEYLTNSILELEPKPVSIRE